MRLPARLQASSSPHTAGRVIRHMATVAAAGVPVAAVLLRNSPTALFAPLGKLKVYLRFFRGCPY